MNLYFRSACTNSVQDFLAFPFNKAVGHDADVEEKHCTLAWNKAFIQALKKTGFSYVSH